MPVDTLITITLTPYHRRVVYEALAFYMGHLNELEKREHYPTNLYHHQACRDIRLQIERQLAKPSGGERCT